METLFELLLPLLFIAIILIINILARVKEAQKGQPGQRRQESPWMQLASTEQIRKFLEEASRGAAGRSRAQQDRQPGIAPRATYGGPAGMPAGTMTPSARRGTSAGGRPAVQEHRREARHLRTPPPPPEPSRVPVEKRHREPQVRTRQARTEKRKFEGALERRLREREAAAAKARETAGVPVSAAAIGEGRGKPASARAKAGPSRLLADFSRSSLRRAIVMSEVLGAPVGLRPPRA